MVRYFFIFRIVGFFVGCFYVLFHFIFERHKSYFWECRAEFFEGFLEIKRRTLDKTNKQKCAYFFALSLQDGNHTIIYGKLFFSYLLWKEKVISLYKVRLEFFLTPEACFLIMSRTLSPCHLNGNSISSICTRDKSLKCSSAVLPVYHR